MSDNTMDGDLNSGGTPASPNAGGSQNGGDSGGSSAEKLQATLDKFNARLEEMDKRTRALQGEKDRGIQQTKKEVDELKRKFAEVEKLKAKGLDDDEAFEELELREAIREIKSQLKPNTPVPSSPAGNGEGSAIDKAKTLEQFGLSENDADVAEALAGRNFSNQLELENTALKIAFKRQNKPSLDASTAPAMTGGTPVKQDASALKGKYIEEISANRGNREAIKTIQAKYRKLGFDPGSVGFSV